MRYIYCHVLILFICCDCVRVLNATNHVSACVRTIQGARVEIEGRWSISGGDIYIQFWILRLFCVPHNFAKLIQIILSMTFIQSYICIEKDMILNKWRRLIWPQFSFNKKSFSLFSRWFPFRMHCKEGCKGCSNWRSDYGCYGRCNIFHGREFLLKKKLSFFCSQTFETVHNDSERSMTSHVFPTL